MQPKVEAIASDFWRRVKMLYMALQSNKLQVRLVCGTVRCEVSQQGSHRAPYLRQLLLRLNFNGYMDMQLQKHGIGAGLGSEGTD